MKEVLKVKQISKTYQAMNGEVEALKDISFSLEEGEFVSLIGPSGCGKSTILNLMSHNDIVSSGEILYNDKNANEFDGGALANDFAYVYQDFKLIDNLTAYQNIMIGSELAENGTDYEFVLEIAKNLGIVDNLDEKVYALSGGEQQRVAIARAIARKPKVIFADEPTGALDYQTGKAVLKLLQDACRKSGMTVVVITHNQALTAMADRIITVKSGTVRNVEINEKIVPVEEIEW